MNKADKDKVIAALEINRVMAADADGNYTREVTPKAITEALTIMRGLAEDEEKLLVAATSPQAAQTATVGPYDLKCKDVIDYPFQAAQTDEREAFEAWYATKTMPPAYSYTEKLIIEVVKKSAWAGWLGRAGRKG